MDEFGLVNWCSQQRGVFTKPFLEYSWKDLTEQFHTRKDCSPTCTIGCVRTASRFDEWRPQRIAAEHPLQWPAVNHDKLIPAASLVRSSEARPKRSQATWRKSQVNAD